MSNGTLHQVEDEMRMNADDTKNSNPRALSSINTSLHAHKLRHIIAKNKNVCLSFKLIQNGCS